MENPGTPHSVSLRCFGDSQWPVIRDDQVVEARPVAPTDIAVGDLIVYRRQKFHICHRVLDRRLEGEACFLVKGDSNALPDGWVPYHCVVGKVFPDSGSVRERRAIRVLRGITGLQYTLFRKLFTGRFGRAAGALRARFSSQPIFTALFFRLTSPWSWFRPRIRWLQAGSPHPEERAALKHGFCLAPPRQTNWRLKPVPTDYGYAYCYEAIFPRDLSRVDAQLNLGSVEDLVVLDAGGGEGRWSRHMAARGARVHYLDNSLSMLTTAVSCLAEIPQQVRGRISWHLQSLEEMELPVRFDHMVCLGNALEFMEDEAAVLRALSRMKAHLKPGGRIWLELHEPAFWRTTPHWGAGKWQLQERFRLRGRKYFVWNRTHHERGGRLLWEHGVSHDGIRYHLMRSSLLLLPDFRWRELFAQAGLSVRALPSLAEPGQSPPPKWLYELTPVPAPSAKAESTLR